MAGLGRKTFIATEVLTAANVNGYLMDQSVMKFASSAARSSAIGTAVSEGMVSYLDSTDSLEVYNGSAWTAVGGSGSGNAAINGGMDIWQRGTSFTVPIANNSFSGPDRFNFSRNGSSSVVTVSQQTFTPGTAPVAGYEAQYFMRFNQTTAGSGGSYNEIITRMEDVRSFAGQTVTFSFFAKTDSSRTLSSALAFRQNFGSGGSGSVDTTIPLNSLALTTSWARYTGTVTLPSIAGKTIGAGSYLEIDMQLFMNTTFTFDTWGWQVEAGSTATAFKRNAPSLQAELAACQRYYWRNTAIGDTVFATGAYYTSTQAWFYVPFPVVMRTAPTSGGFSNVAQVNVYANSALKSATTYAAYTGNSNGFGFNLTTSAATTGIACFATLGTSGNYLEYSAEL